MTVLAVDTEGAAACLGMAVSTLEKLRVTGGGPRYVKAGRAVRYRIVDLEAYLAERVVESTSQARAA
ncbi:MAG TPA: helix-turn-helix domain-containing protein [Allosphingosinicella sp.]|nr:helix-turn-helix domain-containing protein [Allosphingosinicella sp.]